MREFDLSAAKAGAAVCTRNGAHVEIILYNGRTDGFPILAYVGFSARVRSFRNNGQYRLKHKSESDLVMRDDNYAEKLARGEYGNHIHEAIEKVDPVIKENLTVDREYWRRVYAGQMMASVFPVLVAADWQKKGEYANTPTEILIARQSIYFADALLEELEKPEKKL